MEDNGARSNPLETDKGLHLRRLLRLKNQARGRAELPSTPRQPLALRQGAVLDAVTSLLEGADGPMRYAEIRLGVEALLRCSVPASSVRQALSAHSRGSAARFRRLERGLYVLSAWEEGRRLREGG